MTIIIKNKFSRLLALLLVMVVITGLLPPQSAGAADFTITLSPSIMTIFINEKQTITATLTPMPAYTSITWSYSMPGGEAGLGLTDRGTECEVLGIRTGTATVTIEVVVDGIQYTNSCTVYVIERELIQSIILNSYSATIDVGTTIELIATAGPSSATDTSIVWSIDNDNIAELSAKSTENKAPIAITAKAAGITKIRASANDSSGIFVEFTLTVIAPPTGIIMYTSTSLVVGKTATLTAVVQPTTATNKKVVWTSSNLDVAYVNYDTGLITARSVGTCDITAQVEGTDVTATCALKVTVSEYPVEKLEFVQATQTVIEKKTAALVVNITPTNASNKLVYLTSSDVTIATVPASANAGSSFNVTGVKPGTVTITAKSAETNIIQSVCTVTVIETPTNPVTGITLGTTEAVLVVGGTISPKATLAPTSPAPSIKTVSWSSSNKNVATVDAAGKITATGPGTATITARADGSDNITATCVVYVVSLNNDTLSLQQDGHASLSVQNIPSGSGYTVTWATSKTSVTTISSTTGTSTTLTAHGSGEATITATVKLGSATAATLKCTVSVTSDVQTINYQVVGDEIVKLAIGDFTSVCINATGNALSYIKFTSVSTNEGVLYYLYDKAGESKVSTGTLYYNTTAPKIADICFVPIPDFIGPATITYTAVDTKGGTYTGKVVISVGDLTGDIKYRTAMDTPVTFSGDDFNAFCTATTGNTLSSVKFTLPAASEGTLYYMFELDNNKKITGTKTTASANYYYNSDPKLSEVTFMPATGFIGSVDIKFTGRDSRTNPVSGIVRITVGKGTSSGADIEYIIAKNEVLNFDLADFNDYCRIVTGDNLNYVVFSIPSASRGTLHHNYYSSGSNSTVTSVSRYYRNHSPYLYQVFFVPYRDYEGAFTFKFTGMSANGTEFSGTVGIIVGDAYGDVRYSAGINVPINFGNAEFNDFCQAEVGANFEFIQFSLPKASEGVLYHQYGRSGEAAVTEGTSYRRTSKLRLDEITFIPAEGFTGVAEFNFTGKSVSGATISGVVALTYDPNLTGMPIVYYSTSYMPVKLSGADLVAACSKRGDDALVSVKFVLPPSSIGYLYENYIDHNLRGTAVDADKVYNVGTGAGSVSSVTFMPRAETKGAVSIPYYGTDTKGDTFTGYIHITIPAVTASAFNDMDKHTWAAASVEYMRVTGIVNGIGNNSYGPGNSITRGDFMLMLYRAFALKSQNTGNFSDVPQSSYYADAIATGRAIGVALGGTDGKFRPNESITRQDAMVMINRLLAYLNRGVEAGSSSTLNSFSDRSSVSGYAQDAVRALVKAGVIYGDNQGRLNPANSITRAEMAVILHRVITL